MAMLIMWNLTTVDGFMEAPGHDISWHNDIWSSELEQLSIEQCRAAGALMFGRTTYEMMAGYWPSATGEVADFMSRLPKLVFSRRLTQSDWSNVRFFNADVPAAVTKLKRETAKDIFLFGSANLTATLVQHGLIDEFRIGVAPIILGRGTPLFKENDKRIDLNLLDVKSLSNGVVIQRYEPAQ